MCGISGILGASQTGDEHIVAAMVAIQHHRGPDGESIERYPGAALGHNRLAILDLSDHARQPMSSADGRYVIVYNGEIYNHKELRSELSPGRDFHGTGDTEVLLAAWEKWGEDCLNRLNGMFAFCIWDRKNQRAFFARDRFGQKPLFIAKQNGRLVFSSEIKAILAAGVPARPNRSAWLRYLYHASYDDNEETFFDGITQLEPGKCAWWSQKGGLVVRRWYRLSDCTEERDWNSADAADALRDIMIDAGRVHMRSDVPVGVSLSGGLDSSALLACLSAAGKLHTGTNAISIEFDGEGAYSEREWIKAATNHHNMALNIGVYSPSDFPTDFATHIWHAEAPLGGLMNLGRARVMAMAQKTGIKVMQDGTGLDEAFAGYQFHHDLYLGERLASRHPNADTDVQEYARHWCVNEEIARERAQSAWHSTETRAIDGTAMTKIEMLSKDVMGEARDIPLVKLDVTSGNVIRDSLLDYILVRKIPRNTRFTDRMSMAHGVELRFPFLDHRLIEFGISLPNRLHFLHGRSKSIVREAMTGLMDEKVRTAPKRSVHAPQGPWLRSEPIKSYVTNIIHSRSFAERDFFDAEQVKRLFDRFCAGEFNNSFFVWQWINLEEWFRTFIDKPVSVNIRSEGS